MRDWKLTVYANQPNGELFDRVHDPNEMVNLWHDPAYQAIQQKLTQAMLEEVLCSINMLNGRKQNPAAPVSKWEGKHNWI